MKQLNKIVVSMFLVCASSAAFAVKPPVQEPLPPPSKASLLFYTAATNKNYEMMDTYLARGADINCGNCDVYGKPPLAMSVSADMTVDPELTVYLVNHGANVNLLSKGGLMSPLMYALDSSWSTAWAKPRDALLKNVPFLVDNGADVNLVNVNGFNALFFLVAKGYDNYSFKASMQLMRYLVDKGTDVNHQAKDGKTALMFAAGGCGVGSVQNLLFLHANPNLKNKLGETALSIAEDAAVKSGSGSGCNQVVAMLRNPDQYAIDPLANNNVFGAAPTAPAPVGNAPGAQPAPNPAAAVQGLINVFGKVMGK